MVKTRLNQLKNGQVCILDSVELCDYIRKKRLIELGLVKDTKITMLKNNKWSKNVIIGVRGYALTLDYLLASQIIVCGVNDE